MSAHHIRQHARNKNRYPAAIWYQYSNHPSALGLAVVSGALTKQFSNEPLTLLSLASFSEPEIKNAGSQHRLYGFFCQDSAILALQAKANGADTYLLGLSRLANGELQALTVDVDFCHDYPELVLRIMDPLLDVPLLTRLQSETSASLLQQQTGKNSVQLKRLYGDNLLQQLQLNLTHELLSELEQLQQRLLAQGALLRGINIHHWQAPQPLSILRSERARQRAATPLGVAS
ncbi:hypothetical protein MN202_05025 [Rheinheimera muenzenbergensis]|uniref:Uncharacterized protein n=1 Tax=Rheinheimera muenzenbergensis TaxID=1193628 RepID=A0ABU8C4X4_9GAMM